MSHRSQIDELLTVIDGTPVGPTRRVLIDQALTLSQEADDEQAEYEVRMRLADLSGVTGDNDTMLSCFAWCLAKHNADPDRFRAHVPNATSLAWQFGWVTRVLDASPVFALSQCDAVLDDMETHHRRTGLSMRAVIAARFAHAWRTGDIDRARQLRAQLQATPSDDHSDCLACARSKLAGFAAEVGEEALALAIIDEIIDDRDRCAEEPECALGRTLLAKLRAGRTADALDAHLRSYRLARTNPEMIATVADNMVFCAVTGNEARGLAMVERHLAWLTYDPLNEDSHLRLLAAVGLVLEAVARAGHGEQVVRGAASLERFFGAHDGAWTAAELAPAAWQAADRLAAAFDARNGNNTASDRVARTRALLDERYDLPILTEVFLPPAVAPEPPQTAQRWLDLAEIHSGASTTDPAAALEAATRVLDPTLESGDLASPGPGPTPAQQARAAALIISAHLQLGADDDARLMLPRRIAALRAEGRPALAEMEDKTGLGTFGQPTPETIEILRAEVTRWAGTTEELAEAELALAEALLHGDDPDLTQIATLLESAVGLSPNRPRRQAAALHDLMLVHERRAELPQMVDLSDRLLGLDLSDGLRARFLVERAHLMGRLNRFAEGAAAADAAAKIYASYGAARPHVDALALAAWLINDAGQPEERLSRVRYALREAERAEIPTLGIRFGLGGALAATGHLTESIEILWQVLREEEDAEAPPENRAETCAALEQVFGAAQMYEAALSMGHRAADLLQEAERPVNAADMLRRMGNLLRALERYDESLDSLSRAWDLVKDADALAVQIQVLEARAFTKAAGGDQAAVADIDQAIASLQDLPDGPFPWKLADLTDSRAQVLVALERRDEAVAAFLQAADGYAQADDPASAARSEHFAAQNLAGPLDRPAEAVGIWHSALDHVEGAAKPDQTAALRDSILLRLAEALGALGRTTEAAAARAQATGQESAT